jgi:tol-pal system protein YbgF
VRHRLSSVLLLAALTPGCASQLSEVRHDNRRLSGDVAILRAEARADQHTIHDLKNQVFVLRDKLETAQVEAGRAPGGVPRLPVEVLGPDDGAAPAPAAPTPAAAPTADVTDLGPGARVVGVADDGSQIVYVGDAAAGKVATPAPDDDVADPDADRLLGAPPVRHHHHHRRHHHHGAATTAAATPVPATGDRLGTQREVPKVADVAAARHAPPAPRAGDRDAPRIAYQAALDALHRGDHAAAIAGLRDFLRRWPDHDYADNAQYWLGEAYYDQRDYQRALGEFRKTVERYPRGNKVPDALLKVGYCYVSLGRTAQARATLEEVVSIYPRSGPAKLAAARLGTLGK